MLVVGKMLPMQTKREGLQCPAYFSRGWVNIKKVFQDYYNRPSIQGMAAMLKHLKMDLQGRHHSGIDDCRNLARILIRLIEDGATLDITGTTFDPHKKLNAAPKSNAKQAPTQKQPPESPTSLPKQASSSRKTPSRVQGAWGGQK
jgi:hypothetical protein